EWSNEYRNRIENIARFKDSELGIISYPESDEYWYVITTQRVIICEKEQPRSIDIDEIDHYDFWGDFKGVHGKQTEKMKLRTKSGKSDEVRYETGKPSMGTIYGLMTVLAVGRSRQQNPA